jgi:hypothetical protein
VPGHYLDIAMKLPKTKPRNPFVALAHSRKAGTHDKSRKAQRRADKVNLHRLQGRGEGKSDSSSFGAGFLKCLVAGI